MDEIDHAILGFVERYIAANLMAPTLQEIGDFLGRSKATVCLRVAELVKLEWLCHEPGGVRSVRPGPRLRKTHRR